MTTQLTVRFGLDRHGQPLAVIDGLPGAGETDLEYFRRLIAKRRA